MSVRRALALAGVVVLLSATSAQAAPGDTAWTSIYDGPSHTTDSTAVIVADPSGARVFSIGSSGGGAATHVDIATVGYDAGTGARLWARRIDGSAHGTDAPIRLVTNGTGTRVYIVGLLNESTPTERCVLVAYRAATGERIWRHGCSAAPPVIAASGTTLYAANGPRKGRLTAYAGDGSPLWTRKLSANAVSSVNGISVAGGQLDVGATEKFGGIYTRWLIEALDPTDGSRSWIRRYDAPDGQYADLDQIVLTSDASRVYAVGDATLDPARLVVIAAYDGATGVPVWRRQIAPVAGGAVQDPDLAVASDDATLAVGLNEWDSNSAETFFTRSYNADGTARWTNRENAAGETGHLIGVAIAGGGATYVTGYGDVGGVHGSTTFAYAPTGASAWNALVPAVHPAEGWSVLSLAPDGARVFVGSNIDHDMRTDAYLTS